MLNLSDLIQGLDTQKLKEADQKFDRAVLTVGGSVAASTTTPFPLVVSPKGVFLCMSLTGRFTTLTTGPADNGVCSLKMSWQNGSGRVYIDPNSPVYLDCLLTPGRVMTPGVTGDPSNQLQFPGLPWVTFFQPKDVLTFAIQNEATYANTFQINLHGIWLKQ